MENRCTALEDIESSQRVCEAFIDSYYSTLTKADSYLTQIEHNAAIYAEAYRPWHQSLTNLLQGVYLLSKKIPLPNPDEFLDALRTFSFSGTVNFLHDICLCCRIKLEQDWKERFRQHIDALLFAATILLKEKTGPACTH